MNLGQFLKHKRLEKGLTMKELGEKIGKNKTFIYRLEKNNVKSLKNDVMESLANALDLPVIAFFDGFDIDGNNVKETEQITRDDFFNEVVNILNKTDGLSEQQRKHILNTIDFICNDEK